MSQVWGSCAIKRFPVRLLVCIGGLRGFSTTKVVTRSAPNRPNERPECSRRAYGPAAHDGLREFIQVGEAVSWEDGLIFNIGLDGETLSGREESSTRATSVRLAWTGSDILGVFKRPLSVRMKCF